MSKRLSCLHCARILPAQDSLDNLYRFVRKILAVCIPVPNRNTETVMEEKERVALLLCQAKEEHSMLASQELCPTAPPPAPSEQGKVI